MQWGTDSLAARARRATAFLAVGGLLLSPVLVPAFAAQFRDASAAGSTNWTTRFTPAGIDSRLAAKVQRQAIASNNAGSPFRFTPAGLNREGDKVITVAARATLAGAANAVSIQSAIEQIQAGSGTTVRLNNSNYRLTAARGWQDFKLPVNAVHVEQPRLSTIVGKGDFRLDGEEEKKPSRFNTDVSVAKVGKAAPNPRGSAAAGDYEFNVGGSFSISRRIDVTAGVRYASERDRVAPAANAKPDSEAVYVGTKIRF
ncbi:MAG: hypothetical protein ACRCY3_14265 [Sphingorhabdus sp.]